MRVASVASMILMAALGGGPTKAAASESPPPTAAVQAANAVEVTLTGPGADAVAAVERAFAKTMADRDLEAFASFLHADTVWFSGPGGSALQGRDAVIAAWSTFYEGPDAPFAWAPDRVAVTQGGDLAMSTGPVFAPDGTLVARFSSVWQRGGDGRWRIVFDKGETVAPRN